MERTHKRVIRPVFYIIAGALFCLITMLTHTNTVSASVPRNATTDSFAEQPAPNQIVVKYKKDLSPQTLQLQATERKAAKAKMFGSVRLLLSNLKYRINKQELPEEHLLRIQQADDAAGAKNKTRIFDADDENQRNLFVIELDDSKSIEQAIAIYEKIPEVEYAEPNYTYQAF